MNTNERTGLGEIAPLPAGEWGNAGADNFIEEKHIVRPDILTIESEHKEVIRIDLEGRLFWHGREVETDDDFRAAMLELAKRLVEVWAL